VLISKLTGCSANNFLSGAVFFHLERDFYALNAISDANRTVSKQQNLVRKVPSDTSAFFKPFTSKEMVSSYDRPTIRPNFSYIPPRQAIAALQT